METIESLRERLGALEHIGVNKAFLGPLKLLAAAGS